MSTVTLSGTLERTTFYFVGIKGTGMSALAEFLSSQGATVTGSDTKETFPTESVLKKAGIAFAEGFSSENVPSGDIVVVYSSAYDPENHPELVEAQRRKHSCHEYSVMLGYISSLYYSAGISGVHGKTTTTALAGMIVKATDIPATVMVPTAVPGFGGGSVFKGGTSYFITETCEYRRHFLHFSPKVILVTNIELEHTDYFKDIDDIADAFFEYINLLPDDGTLVYCADDPGATALAKRIHAERPLVKTIPYGITADDGFRIADIRAKDRHVDFAVEAPDKTVYSYTLNVPGRHNVMNATGALALVGALANDSVVACADDFYARAGRGISSFTGSRRRCEVVGEAQGIMVVDDYAHHPTALRTTIAGLKEFYPGRRIIVDFMPHLFSRTADLFDDFVGAFNDADALILHEVYSSARESSGLVSGQDLYRAVSRSMSNVSYFEYPMDAYEHLLATLKPRDVLITMGAGDNWQLGKAITEKLESEESQ